MSKRYWRNVNTLAATIQSGAIKEDQALGKIEEAIQKLPNGRLPEEKFKEVFRRVANAAYSVGPKGVQKGSYVRIKLIEFLRKFSETHGKPTEAEEVINTLVKRNNGWSHA